ncbi:MAG: TetR/AcrR family transcriptional regulator [Mycobacterium sp.]|nr:TetR/AcrR family transcriptional regulator [Mycobacterium sp.]
MVSAPAKRLTQPERLELSGRRLLQAAADLIVEKGWEATTAAEIGRRAGYSRAMVHARFGSKDAILDAFLQTYAGDLNPDPDPNDTGLQQVLAHLDRVREVYDRDPELLRAMFVGTFEAVKSTSPLRTRMQDQLESGIAKIIAGLRKGIMDGSVRPNVDVDAAAADITAALFGVAFQWVVVDSTVALDVMLQQARSRIATTYGT